MDEGWKYSGASVSRLVGSLCETVGRWVVESVGRRVGGSEGRRVGGSVDRWIGRWVGWGMENFIWIHR